MGVHVKVAGAWQEIGVDAAGGVGWAKVTGGTVTEYTKPDGSVMEVHTYTANGTLTVAEAGVAEVLIVGGGGGGGYNLGGGGGAGGVKEEALRLAAGTLNVVVGTGGAAGTSSANGVDGTQSYIAGTGYTGTAGYEQGIIWAHFGRGGGLNGAANTGAGGGFVFLGGSRPTPIQPGRTSSVSGTAVRYGDAGGIGAGLMSQTPGSGGNGGNSGAAGSAGKNGIVIVAVQKSAPTAPADAIVATGGTETTYTGNGSNGVSGQQYKVHTFSADGTFTVTQGGECDILLVGGGGAGTARTYGGAGGGGGEVIELAGVNLTPGSYAMTVGPGGVFTSNADLVNRPPGGTSKVIGNGLRVHAVGGGMGGGYAGDANTGGSGAAAGGRGGDTAPNGGFAMTGGQGGSGVNGNSGGGAGGNASGRTPGPGIVSTITGSSVEYGKGGTGRADDNTAGNNVPTPNIPGHGGNGADPGPAYNGANGVVVVRYKVA